MLSSIYFARIRSWITQFSPLWILKGGRQGERAREKRAEISCCPFWLTRNGLKAVRRHDIVPINSGSDVLHMAGDPLYRFISFGFNSSVLSIRMMDLSRSWRLPSESQNLLWHAGGVLHLEAAGASILLPQRSQAGRGSESAGLDLSARKSSELSW